MVKESSVRSQVVSALKPLGAIPVENGRTYLGTPDINTVRGWIEVKHIESAPLKAVLNIPHFTPQQKSFIKLRTSLFLKGISPLKSYLIIKIGKLEWLLLEGDNALKVGCLTKEELIKLSCYYSNTGLNKKELLKCFNLT